MNYELLTNKYTFMDMDFDEIVIGGYQKESKYLSQFFYRKWKEAENQNYSKVVFFGKCNDVTERMEQYIRRSVNGDKREEFDFLNDAKSGNPNINMNASEQDLNHFIEESESRLLDLQLNGIWQDSVPLYHFTGGKYVDSIWYKDILWIREQLKVAEKMDEPHPTEQAKKFEITLNDSERTKVFTDYLLNVDKVKLMILLKDVLVGAKAKVTARFIISLKELHYIDMPTPRNNLYPAMRDEFGNFGTDSAMNQYFNEEISETSKISTKILFKEIEETKQLIEKHLNS